MIRYRVPMDAVLIVFAAVAVVAVGERIGRIEMSATATARQGGGDRRNHSS
jgi:hypothetical protein